jgi:hypothetical protein
MKQLLLPANATFNASAKTITFATTIPASISHILHITNVTTGTLMFQPQAGALYTGTYANPILTLTCSNVGMADTDKLEIFYDDGLAQLKEGGSVVVTSSPALTDTQLRATAVPVSVSGVATETTLAAQSTLMGAVTETAPASDTAISGLNGRLQRIAQNITTMISNITEMITATNRSGTREYNMAGITRQAVGAASARVALPTLGASRELYVTASTRCFFRSGDSSITAAAGASHPLAADERFHLRVPAGHTHIAYIRDSSDGNITIVPVA